MCMRAGVSARSSRIPETPKSQPGAERSANVMEIFAAMESDAGSKENGVHLRQLMHQDNYPS